MAIQLLDPHTAELIAAGEVVERPASVVKELCENAIDAGASSITVEIERGGISLIRITDDGDGIAADEVELAFMRHATSKVKTEEDLDAIYTLGFRGEALASIASVARVELLTKTDFDEDATLYTVEGGAEGEKYPAARQRGTTITVRDIFYNVPARMKFLRKDASEAMFVSEAMSQLAISNPNIAFAYYKDGKEVFVTPGDGDLYSAVYYVLGPVFARALISVADGSNNCRVAGLITSPHASRASRSMQFFFVNGRYVKNRTMMAALEQAYRGMAMQGRYPGAVLFLQMPPELVDVNVHPAKTEVRFAHEQDIFGVVYRAVKSALMEAEDQYKQFIFSEEDDVQEEIVDTGSEQVQTEQVQIEQVQDFSELLSMVEEKSEEQSLANEEISQDAQEPVIYVESEVQVDTAYAAQEAVTELEDDSSAIGLGQILESSGAYVPYVTSANVQTIETDVFDEAEPKENEDMFTQPQAEEDAEATLDIFGAVEAEAEENEDMFTQLQAEEDIEDTLDMFGAIEAEAEENEDMFTQLQAEEDAEAALDMFGAVEAEAEENEDMFTQLQAEEDAEDALDIFSAVEAEAEENEDMFTQPQAEEDAEDTLDIFGAIEAEAEENEDMFTQPQAEEDAEDAINIFDTKELIEDEVNAGLAAIFNNAELEMNEGLFAQPQAEESADEVDVFDVVEPQDDLFTDVSAQADDGMLQESEDIFEEDFFDVGKEQDTEAQPNNIEDFFDVDEVQTSSDIDLFDVEDVEPQEDFAQNVLQAIALQDQDIDAPMSLSQYVESDVVAEQESMDIPQEEQTMRLVGEIFKTYILAEHNNVLCLVDKHAAHERILYEQLISERGSAGSQQLLAPVHVDLSAAEKDALLQNSDVLMNAGIEVEDFGGNAVLVRGVPDDVENTDIENLVIEVAARMSENGNDSMNEKTEWVLHSIACRAATKAGDTTHPEELLALACDILSGRVPMFCPHGRPVVLEITKKELEKQFGRLG